MGRLIAAFAALLLFGTSTASAEDAINPTKWSKNQWRSDLFDTYPTYPRHFRTKVIRHETVVRTVIVPSSPAAGNRTEVTRPVRPQLIRIDGTHVPRLQARSVAGAARGCSGALVITWAGDRATSKCHRSALPKGPAEGP